MKLGGENGLNCNRQGARRRSGSGGTVDLKPLIVEACSPYGIDRKSVSASKLALLTKNQELSSDFLRSANAFGVS